MKPEFKLKKKRILVAGGAGFIGSNLCEYFLECEAKVTCLTAFLRDGVPIIIYPF